MHVNTEDSLFRQPLALSMLIDIFSERGFHAVVDKHIQPIPERIDLTTGVIELRKKLSFASRSISKAPKFVAAKRAIHNDDSSVAAAFVLIHGGQDQLYFGGFMGLESEVEFDELIGQLHQFVD